MQNFSQSKNKLRYAYLLTAEFLKRKVVEFETLQVDIKALRVEL